MEQCGFPTGISNWILCNLEFVTLQTYALINELINNRREYADEYLTLSTRVIIGDELEDFLDLYSVNRHWIIDDEVLFRNINNSRQADSVKLEYLEELIDQMCTTSIKKSFKKR